MANSRFEYVRAYEQPDFLLPNTFVVVRIDGRGFTKLTTKYKFEKPNDRPALDLMNAAAKAVMKELPDLVLAYGQSDEFSFVFHKDCQLFERRASKLTTTIVSTFTANYVFAWSQFFPDKPLTLPLPSFDGRAVCYPSEVNLRDYLSWRQVDCHINNLYNTTFWALVNGGMDPRDAEQELSGTVSSDKNEILFSRFGINYNKEPEIFRKGSVLYRDFFPTSTHSSPLPQKTAQSPPPPLSHPQPKRPLKRPMSQPLERTDHGLLRDSPISGMSERTAEPPTPRGPTFLSTSTTPSPPPSPSSQLIPTFRMSGSDKSSFMYPQTFFPVSPSANGSAARQHLPILTPLPLPPPILRPSTRPPPSLNPPNPTSHTNTSPLPSPNINGPIYNAMPTLSSVVSKPTRPPVSHSASASLSRPLAAAPSALKPAPKRSPSMSIINFAPPQIPLRISSIPLNASPRKLSLPTQKSYSMLRAEERESAGVTLLNISFNRDGRERDKIGPKTSPQPYMKTMKELPSPTAADEQWTSYTRSAVMGSSPHAWPVSPMPQDHTHTDGPRLGVAIDSSSGHVVSPARPTLRGCTSSSTTTRRARSHSRLHSAPPTSTSYFAMDDDEVPPTPPAKDIETPRNRSGFADFNWAGTPGTTHTQQYLESKQARSRSSPPPPPASSSSQPFQPQPPQIRSPNPPSKTKSKDKKSSPKSPQLYPTPTTKKPNESEYFPGSTSNPHANQNENSQELPIGVQTTITSQGHAPNTTNTDTTKKSSKKTRPQKQSQIQNPTSRSARDKDRKKRMKAHVVIEHVDMIKEAFWERRPWILSGRTG